MLANVTLVAGTITGNTFYDYVGFDTYHVMLLFMLMLRLILMLKLLLMLLLVFLMLAFIVYKLLIKFKPQCLGSSSQLILFADPNRHPNIVI